MLEQFLRHIDHHRLCTTDQTILLAVSGGIDSMVMAHLFVTAGFRVGIAHANFRLRGDESDKDEAFVTETGNGLKVQVHTRRFDTGRFAATQKLSIQVAARVLRYEFFTELQAMHGYHRVATAHQLDDALETTLFNLARGTGVEGLTGIPVRHDDVIRPMLFATRQMIETYAAQHDIRWREDSSNRTDKYSRNMIRHDVVPVLKQINPALEETFRNTLERVQGAWDMTLAGIENFKQQALQHDGERVHISAELLNKEPSPGWLLWELIKEYGFTFQQCKLAAGANHSGKIFQTNTHQLTYDRARFVLTPLTDGGTAFETVVAEGSREVQHQGHTLRLEEKEAQGFKLTPDVNVAQVDADRISFPLTWRSWREGDHFVPLGMKHNKKVSDFLIDSKVSLPDKQHITVVTSGEQIVWLPGLRIADPFKVTDQTRRILVMTHTLMT